jgi:predicted kinase
MAGAAGSGKSWARENDVDLVALPVVDSDDIKKEHPDFDPKQPHLIHEWSSVEATRRFYGKLADGESFIFDGTGTNAEKYISMINEAHRAGFNVAVVYVKVTLATSLKRNAERERTVPEYVVREQHSLLPFAIQIIRDAADNFRIINN